MRKYLIALIVLIILAFVSPAYAWRRGSVWNQGDLDMGGYSLNGRSTSDTTDRDGVLFDPDSDGTIEAYFASEGGLVLSEQSEPDTTPINTFKLYLNSTTKNVEILFDDGDTATLATF